MSNQQQVLVEGSESKVNEWYFNQAWRIPYPFDEQFADEIKQALYLWMPTADLNDDPGFATWEANTRAALVQIIDELDRNSLRPLFEAARSLALYPITFEDEAS